MGRNMVLLAISAKGLDEALRISARTGEAVWCSADAVAEPDFQALTPMGVTRFAYGLAGDNATRLESAVATIEEHHPGQVVWVEAIQSAA